VSGTFLPRSACPPCCDSRGQDEHVLLDGVFLARVLPGLLGNEGAVDAAFGGFERLARTVEPGFRVATVLDRDRSGLDDVVDVAWVVVPAAVVLFGVRRERAMDDDGRAA
jgi:hypothetical protein